MRINFKRFQYFNRNSNIPFFQQPTISESKARAVYESAGLPFPEADLIQLPGWTEIHIKKPAETFKALKHARAKAE